MTSETYNTNKLFNLAADVYLQFGYFEKVRKVIELHRSEIRSQETETTYKKAISCIDFRKNLDSLVLN